jgi:hypothetical protein
MARLGHFTPRAALIYQHAASDRDEAIARALEQAMVLQVVPTNGGTVSEGTAADAEVSNVVDLSSRVPRRGATAATTRHRRQRMSSVPSQIRPDDA